MTVNEFAQRVLFSESLEEKLAAPPPDVTDGPEGGVLLSAAPPAPGRPAVLRPADHGQRMPLPALRDLEADRGRGLLLHFFANHELLATELMALALLRFPDAPAEFRRGLLRTLRDEQIHTRLYLRRMEECGVTFGDYPVNGYFWRVVADMETPLDYVSRLSLTFEQANLDYARHYAGLFRQAGDEATGRLLDRIYRDEIAHVGYGLKWFRRWKEPGQSDWNEYARVLPAPLSAARARGGTVPFNADGRQRAGLEPEFIESLRLFAGSRGRAPDVHFFNPAAEVCAAAGGAAPALTDRTTRTLAEDLDILPLFLARADDAVLVRRAPDPAHLRTLVEAGVPTAEFHVLDRRDLLPPDSPLRSRRLGLLRPWGWSPDSLATMSGLEHASGAAVGPPAAEPMRRLFSKAETVPLIAAAGAALGEMQGGPALPVMAAVARSAEEAAAWARELAQASPSGGAVLKAPWGLAGRGLQFCGRAWWEPDSPVAVWIAQILATQSALVVEPSLERLADFSVHYDVAEPGEAPKLRGMVRLHNDDAGRFTGCTAAAVFTRLLPPEIIRWNHRSGMPDGGLITAFYRDVLPCLLREHLADGGFTGWFGIDAFFHRTGDGSVALRPVCELNPRCTMGRVTLELRRFAPSAPTVIYRIWQRRRLAAQGFATLPDFAAWLRETRPVIMAPAARGGGILSGALVLNDPAAAKQFLAVLHAGPEATASALT